MILAAPLLLVPLELLGAASGVPAPLRPVAPILDEGPLRNDTLLPRSEAAQAELVAGDRAWRVARKGGPRLELERGRAFEAWRRALVASVPGESVRLLDDEGVAEGLWPDPDGTHHRRGEGVEAAVQRRLAALTPADREAWRERFGPGAAAALAGAPYDPAALRRLERGEPLTEGAAVAALRLAEVELEAGRRGAAATWLERAGAHAAEIAGADALRAAIAERLGTAAALKPAKAREAWRTASRLRLVRSERIQSTRRIGRDPRPLPLGRGLEPGAAFLEGGALVVQGPHALLVLPPQALATGAPTEWRRRIADVLDLEVVRPYAAPSAGGWPLLPATQGRDAVLVVDRGVSGRVLRDLSLPARGNRLACLRFTEDGLALPRWNLGDRTLGREGREPVPTSQVLGVEGRLEFQPGPLIQGGTVYAQARVLLDSTQEGALAGTSRGGELWLFALDLDDGELRWRRFLTRAADLRRDRGSRNTSRSQVPTSGMPLALVDGVLVVGTNVGLVSAFDAADGRALWSLRTRRREAQDPGWPGSRPPLVASLEGARGGGVLVAPFDSDHLYALPAGPALQGGIFAGAPEPMGALLDVVAADGVAAGGGVERVFLGRDGRHSALRFRRGAGPLRSSLYLDDGERFTGAALASEQRVYVASDRALYLFDRGRELALLDALSLPDHGGGIGGRVVARGSVVAVVGRDTLWVLAAQ